jgi:hypothetical protein
MLAHVIGMPVEETVLQVAPAAAAAATLLAINARDGLSRLRDRLRRRC